jgi:hypothetical protein
VKTRNGFVSNSSSSSFVVPKEALTLIQIFLIKNYNLVSEFLLENGFKHRELLDYAEGWEIKVTKDEVSGNTSMDNFDMEGFMQQIGVPMALVKFEHGHW